MFLPSQMDVLLTTALSMLMNCFLDVLPTAAQSTLNNP